MTKNELICMNRLNNVLKRHSMKIVHNTVENLPVEYELFMTERKDDGSEQDEKLLCNWFSFDGMMGFCSDSVPIRSSIFVILHDAYILVHWAKNISGLISIDSWTMNTLINGPEKTAMSEACVELKDLMRCKCVDEMLITMDLLGL